VKAWSSYLDRENQGSTKEVSNGHRLKSIQIYTDKLIGA
jgi:hypothetical protein